MSTEYPDGFALYIIFVENFNNHPKFKRKEKRTSVIVIVKVAVILVSLLTDTLWYKLVETVLSDDTKKFMTYNPESISIMD